VILIAGAIVAAAVLIGWAALEICQRAWEAAYVKRPWPKSEPKPPKVWQEGEREKADAEIHEAVLTWVSTGSPHGPGALFEKDPSFAIQELARVCRENKDQRGLEFIAPLGGHLGLGEDGHMRKEAIEAFVGFLDHDYRTIREMAAQDLAQMDNEDLSPEQRARVIEAFRKHPSSGMARLVGRVGGAAAVAALREVEDRGREQYDADFYMAYRLARTLRYMPLDEQQKYSAQAGSSLNAGVRVALARLGQKQYEADFVEAFRKERRDQIVKRDLMLDLFYIESPGAIEALGDDMESPTATGRGLPRADRLPLKEVILFGLGRRIPDFPMDYPQGSRREVRMCARWWKRNKARVLKDFEVQWEKRATESGLRG
jgi:hypothetical protein